MTAIPPDSITTKQNADLRFETISNQADLVNIELNGPFIKIRPAKSIGLNPKIFTGLPIRFERAWRVSSPPIAGSGR